MSVHISTDVLTARWYDDGDGYLEKKPFRAVCSIMLLNDTEAFLYAMHGKVSKHDMRDLFEQLQVYGVSSILAARRGKMESRDIAEMLRKL